MLKLPNVTLLAVTSTDIEATKFAIEESLKQIEPEAVAFVTDAGLWSSDAYSRYMLYEATKHVKTDYALVIQYDGYVQDATNWCGCFYDYDYIGAPWPPKTHYTAEGEEVRVGNGGFSLRSKKLYQALLDFKIMEKPQEQEDDMICRVYRKELEAKYGGFCSSVADTGGYGRGIVTELQNRLGIPLEAADKSGNKLGNIALMNSDFLSGRLLADPASALAKEWLTLSRRVRVGDQKVLLQHSDLGDAALYAWRATLTWASSEMEVKPLTGTPEYWIERDRDAAAQFVEKRNDLKKALSERNTGNW